MVRQLLLVVIGAGSIAACSSSDFVASPGDGGAGKGGASRGGAGGSAGSSSGSGGVGGTADSGGGSTGVGGNAGSSGGSSVAGGSAGSGGGSGGVGGSAGSSGGVGGSGGAAGADPVACNVSPQIWPTFNRGCTTNDSCAIGLHQINCCGTRTATGINHSELARFDADEAICESQYPACGCMQGPTTTDTGESTADESTIKVECRSGTCTTFINL